MYDFLLNVRILRERENEFQLFLFLSEKFLQGVQWNVHKECIDEGSEFISESLGGISLFSFQKKCKTSTKFMQGVHKLVETLEVIS